MRLSKHEVRIAARTFRRHPGFAITAVLSLALAIALNTTMYSFLDALVSPKLDVRDVNRFYSVRVFRDFRIRIDADPLIATLLRSRMQTYDALTSQTVGSNPELITFDGQIERSLIMGVAPNLFDVYGVRIIRGRDFDQSDAVAETTPVAISDRLARRLSPQKPFPLDTAIYVDGRRHPVVGIVKGGALVSGVNHPDVFQPLDLRGKYPEIVRLKPGVSHAEAQQEFDQLAVQFALMTGDDPKLTKFDLRALTESQFHFHLFHFALIAAVIAVLLIACANLANLQLARGISRSRELALRTALGATRRDIIVQLLLESAVIAAAGLAMGLLLTFWGTHFLAARVPPSIADYVIEPQISWRLFAVAAIATLFCVLVIGLIPAIRVSQADPNDMLKSGAGTGAMRRHRRQYAVMVIAEIGLSLSLLSGAAIVVHAALVLRDAELPFDPKPIVHGGFILMTPSDTTVDAMAFITGVVGGLRAMPDVADASFTYPQHAPHNAVTIDEHGGVPHEWPASIMSYAVTTSDHFRTLGLPILKGKNFADGIAAVPEVIVDERTARALWPGGNPVGQEIKLGSYDSDAPWLRVIGVVADMYPQRMRYSPSALQPRVGDIYVSRSVSDPVKIGNHRAMFVYFDARAKRDPAQLLSTIQRSLPRGGFVYSASASPLEDELGITRVLQRQSFVTSLFITFAVMAVGLAALGIFGIVAHSVAERRRELGVRLALGATDRHILHVVLREGNAVALAGIAFGLLVTRFTAGWLDAFIIDGDQYNAPLFAGMAVLLFVIVLCAALRPALVATRIDPVESLRCE
jgi:putative ABC transport system permease protein